jgi:hypothetical protein
LSELKNFTVPMGMIVFPSFWRDDCRPARAESCEKEGKRGRKAPGTIDLRLVALRIWAHLAELQGESIFPTSASGSNGLR